MSRKVVELSSDRKELIVQLSGDDLSGSKIAGLIRIVEDKKVHCINISETV